MAGNGDQGLPVFGRGALTGEAPTTYLVPMGMTVGVRINTHGVMVLGTGDFAGEDGQTHRPSEGLLHAGDLILRINNEEITSKEFLSERVAQSDAPVILLVLRDEEEFTIEITPAAAKKDGVRRIGIWVRDSTKGIGTLTFYDPQTHQFGALGHGIMDVDTKLLMGVRDGSVMLSTITSVKRGERGAPGELEGSVQQNRTLGTVTANTSGGIFGQMEPAALPDLPAALPTANRSQITTGSATLLTNAVDNRVQEFDIIIENVNRFATEETKGMVIRITDPALLEATGGIVQGMSGSPILQNGHIIGAVTHVFVQDPARGYAIFIENMLGHGMCD